MLLALKFTKYDLDADADDQSDDNDQSTIFASYNGGSIHEESEIEIHELYRPVDDGYYVDVQPLAEVANAVSIQIEPLSISDWELIDPNTQYLEEGGLLQQVSVVYPNQVLCLKFETDLVKVRVLPGSFLLAKANWLLRRTNVTTQ